MAVTRYKTLSDKNAITLSELLIATVIVGIIMLGVVSADFAIQKFYKDSSTGAVTGFNTIAMINNINNAAFNAVGSITPVADKGILIDTSITGGLDSVAANTFCFRTTQNPPWQCYSGLLDASNVLNLYSCSKNSASSCATTDTKLAPITSVQASFTVVTTAGSQRCLFTVTLQVPDTNNTTKTYVSSISPPNHRL